MADAAVVDSSPFGNRDPGRLDRAVLALTRAMPANWLGLRLAMAFRRITMRRLGEGAIDTMLWGMRLRLYPRRNGCEKNALFTPQMFDVFERDMLAQAIERCRGDGKAFVFVDIGANVGLYSLFVAARAGGDARVLAIEPQPGILERLRFNLAENPRAAVDVLPIAIADHEGTVELLIDRRDSGGTRIDKDASVTGGAETVQVPCHTLASVLTDRGIDAIDALKIDVEGAEDLALAPFLREAPQHLLPSLVLIEDTRERWRVDVFAMLERRGYTAVARSRQNVAFRRAEAIIPKSG